MPLFKKKQETQIPPVPVSDISGASSIRSSSNTYVASRDGSFYNTPTSDQTSNYNSDLADKYNRSRGIGDVYSRGTAELDKDRNELFSGYNAAKSGSGRFFDGADTGKRDEDENDEDIEGIKQQTRFIKQESVNSTTNALRLARQAEDAGRNTLLRLGEQSEKLANTEQSLESSKTHTSKAEDNTKEIAKLNRSIFRPAISFNKDSKHAKKQLEIQSRFDEEREEREIVAKSIRETQRRIGDADDHLGNRSRVKTAEELAARGEQRKRFQFESTASDDESEDKIDDGLDDIGIAVKRLGILARAAGEEVDAQNARIERITAKADKLDDKLRWGTERLKRIK